MIYSCSGSSQIGCSIMVGHKHTTAWPQPNMWIYVLQLSPDITTFLIMGRCSRSVGRRVWQPSCVNLSMLVKTSGLRKGTYTCHILNKQKTSLLCVFYCEISGLQSEKMTCHRTSRKRDFFLWFSDISPQVVFSAKVLSHWGHEYGFSPKWILLCLFRSPDWEKDLLQDEQVKGLSPVCVLWCVFRLADTEKAWSHWGQG